MKLLTNLLTTEAGLMSAGVILFMLVMGAYLYVRLTKLMQEKPGKTGWN
jgi:hypothetical protein